MLSSTSRIYEQTQPAKTQIMSGEELAKAVVNLKQLDDLKVSDAEQYAAAKAKFEDAVGASRSVVCRRKTMRVETNLEVTIVDADGRHEGCAIRNISEGGVYVETDRSYERGASFTILIRQVQEVLELPVDVRWASVEASPGGVGPGVGVAWKELSDEHKRAVRVLVQQAFERIQGPG
ncbi:MAG: PilZ domain-containing protein [Myxococcota bacterium]